jgi:inosine-uridine nucleoside N-ribohydrolase
MPRRLVLDCDTGTDDAIAIMLAALDPTLDLVGVTTVNGNVEVRHCTRNSLSVLDAIGRADVPVFEGASRPLVHPDFPIPRKPRNTYGDRVDHLPTPPPTIAKRNKTALEFLIETFRSANDDITLVPTGPLTNIATAIAVAPDFVQRVPQIVIMGGGDAVSNVTGAAEFNIWADAEAAASVFQAGFADITLVPLDATHQALVSRADTAQLAALGTPASTAAADIMQRRLEKFDDEGTFPERGVAPVHDAVCVACLIDPAVITTRRVHVAVETRGELTLGRTVMSREHHGKRPNCSVAYAADRRRFFDLLLDAFSRPSSRARPSDPKLTERP